MATTFSMWLIDNGTLDGCTLGMAQQMMMENIGTHARINWLYVPVPGHLDAMYYPPNELHLFLAWIYPDEWKQYCVYMRLVG